MYSWNALMVEPTFTEAGMNTNKVSVISSTSTVISGVEMKNCITLQINKTIKIRRYNFKRVP